MASLDEAYNCRDSRKSDVNNTSIIDKIQTMIKKEMYGVNEIPTYWNEITGIKGQRNQN